MSTTTTVTRTGYGYGRNTNAGELPILVAILAVLIGLVGLFLLVVGLLLAAASFGVVGLPAVGAYSVVSGTELYAGVITLIFGGALVVVATGLWDTELWALVLTGIVVAVLVGLLVLAGSFGWTLLIATGLLIYLVAVRSHFY
jgi:hypothetical protein